MGMFKEESGKVSSKRIGAIAYLAAGLIFITVDQIFDKEISFQVLLLVIGNGSALLGLDIIKYFSKKPPSK
jgi:hypothetical protein